MSDLRSAPHGRANEHPNGRDRRPLVAYGLALLAVGLATALTALLWPYDEQNPSAFFYLAVLVVTIYGSARAGLLAALLSALLIGDSRRAQRPAATKLFNEIKMRSGARPLCLA